MTVFWQWKYWSQPQEAHDDFGFCKRPDNMEPYHCAAQWNTADFGRKDRRGKLKVLLKQV